MISSKVDEGGTKDVPCTKHRLFKHTEDGSIWLLLEDTNDEDVAFVCTCVVPADYFTGDFVGRMMYFSESDELIPWVGSLTITQE